MRRATLYINRTAKAVIFLSTLSLRRATSHKKNTSFHKLFLSTLSLRRATPSSTVIVILRKNFYPRSPCGERQPYPDNKPTQRAISIHALLAESDQHQRKHKDGTQQFLSTLSLRRATVKPIIGKINTRDFYPRSPCGERHRFGRPIDVQFVFLSTLSLRRATCYSLGYPASGRHFYPRSPCGERRLPTALRTPHQNFYPRSPCGERPNLRQNQHRRKRISIHALLAESDMRAE